MAEVIYERRYEESGGYIHVILWRYPPKSPQGGDDYRMLSTLVGAGTMPGTREFVSMLDQCVTRTPPGSVGDGIMDLTQSRGAPIRCQFILGKWMIKNKKRVGRIMLVGAPPLERRIAKAVARIARFKNIFFLATMQEAQRDLGWSE